MDDELERSLPRGVALSWGLVKQPQRGPKREMSLKQIVDAAVAIADKDGLSAVSMGRIAESLGFTAMSLYRYIPSKDDLVLLMQEAVVDIPIRQEEAGVNWRQNLRDFVQTIIQCYRDHPWFCDIPVSGIPITPNNLRIADWALRIMSALPLTDQEKFSVLILLTSYARVISMFERDLSRAVQAGASQDALSGLQYSAALKQLVTPERFPYLHPTVMSGTYTGENDDENSPGSEVDFGLERILDGIDCYVNAKKSGEPELP